LASLIPQTNHTISHKLGKYYYVIANQIILKEKDYIDALFHISCGDAKTTLIEFDRLNKSLRQILDHFASIYSTRRSLVSDCRAVKNFTCKKGELLKAAMHRYDIILDKVRHLHSEQAWPEVSCNMKKAKLMQILADETHIYVQNEEEDAIEATGMPYEFDKLVRLACKYESNTISCQVKASRPFLMLR